MATADRTTAKRSANTSHNQHLREDQSGCQTPAQFTAVHIHERNGSIQPRRLVFREGNISAGNYTLDTGISGAPGYFSALDFSKPVSVRPRKSNLKWLWLSQSEPTSAQRGFSCEDYCYRDKSSTFRGFSFRTRQESSGAKPRQNLRVNLKLIPGVFPNRKKD